MRLLIDTDIFCKLAICDLLNDAVRVLGVEQLSECGRLPALPHMLRRGKLPKLFGAEACDAIHPLAEAIPVIGSASSSWLGKLASVDAIDPGEAQLFSVAAELGLLLMSGDKRALRALKAVDGFEVALAGRIVVLEAILLALCGALGVEEVRRRVAPAMAADTMVKVCFSPTNADPESALRSYLSATIAEIEPLVLWSATEGVAP